MRAFPAPQGTLLVLDRGEELHASLRAYARRERPGTSWLSGLGGSARAVLGFYQPAARSYRWTEHAEDLEILHLTGNLTWVDGAPFWHVHGVFSGPDGRAVGGHVRELVIGLTGELLLTPVPVTVTRSHDDATGLELLG